MTTPTTVVDIETWTHKPWPSSVPADRFTVVYTDPENGRVWRVATRATEAEARDFAEAHGWTVGRVYREEAVR